MCEHNVYQILYYKTTYGIYIAKSICMECAQDITEELSKS